MTGTQSKQVAVDGNRSVVPPTSPPMIAYAVLLGGIVSAILVAGGAWTYLPDAIFWVPLMAAAYLTIVPTLPNLALASSLGSTATVAAAMLYPPSAVALFTLLGAAHWRELRGEAPPAMALFNHSMFALCGAAASLAVGVVYSTVGRGEWQLVPAAVFAVITYDLANTLLLAIMLVVRRGHPWRQAFDEAANPFPRFAANAGASALLSMLVVVLVRDVGRWSILLMAVPLWLSHSAQRSAREAQDRADELAVRVRELEILNELSSDLLTVRAADEVERIAKGALESDASETVRQIDLSGRAEHDAGIAIPITGAEPAVVIVSETIDGPTRAMIEAAASLVGLTLARLELEQELAATERARTALTAQILEEATRERSRIAMEVHDDVLPLFAAAQMQVDNVDRLLEMNDRDRAIETVERATAGVSDGIRALRDTLEALRQSTLVPGTVTDGVRRLLSDLQARTGVRGDVDAPDPMPQLPFAVELLAYETIRGCLANVEKHAHASSVQVEFRLDEGRLVVLMQDDGRGFDPTAIGERSHGVALMQQRAELARGAFEITGTSGVGTTVRLEVPTW